MSNPAVKSIEEYLEVWRKRRWVSAFEMAEAMEVNPRTVRNWLREQETCLEAWMAHEDVRFIRFTAASAIRFVEEGFKIAASLK